jgi:phage terminase small subunit
VGRKKNLDFVLASRAMTVVLGFSTTTACPEQSHMSNSTSTALPVEFSRPELLDVFEIPPGNYTVWSDDQRIQAEVVARLFATSYMRDFSHKNAAVRLGVEWEAANLVGKQILNHWLTRHYIAELQDQLFERGLVTQNKVAALLLRDASNFGPDAVPQARVAAQKVLAEAVGLNAKQKAETEAAAASKVKGGVVFVPLVVDEKTWETMATANQRKIMAEADLDDT